MGILGWGCLRKHNSQPKNIQTTVTHPLLNITWNVKQHKYNMSQVVPQHLGDNFYLFQDGIGRFKNQEHAEEVCLKTKISLEEVVNTAKTNDLRPKNFTEYIGQDKIKSSILTTIEACKIMKKPLPHMLFSGQFGTGKTTIAKIIANTLDVNIISTTASSLDHKNGILKLFTNEKIQQKKNPIIFIDEIHNLKPELAEQLYTALEDFTFDYTDEAGLSKSYQVNPFTLIGATTQRGKLDLAFLSRFEVYNLEPYQVAELEIIAKNLLNRIDKNYQVDDAATLTIAKVSRNTARTCTLLATSCYRQALVNHKPLDVNIVNEVLKDKEIDAKGLTQLDRLYLKFLSSVETAGLNTLAKKLMMNGGDKKTLENITEPYLLHLGFLEFTPRGRKITEQGIEYIL